MACTVVTKAKVESFEAWKSGYDQGEGVRRELGVRSVSVLRDAADPSVVILVTRFDSLEAAKAMMSSPKFAEARKKAGAPPLEVTYTNVVEDKTY
jgi:heme-degrading monooxygenase HmoA